MADRYWVGGSGTWNSSSTANWSTTSGGASGASAPTSADNAYFDGNSDSGAPFTVTLGTGAVCADVIIGDGSTVTVLDQTMTLAIGAAWGIYGSLYFPATNLTRTLSGSVSFLATSTGHTVTTNGVSLASDVNFNGAGGGWTLGSALTTTSKIEIQEGSFDTASFSVTANNFFSLISSTRTISFGSSNITITGSTGLLINPSNLTFSAGTSNITMNGPSATFNGTFGVTGGGLTFYDVSFVSAAITGIPVSGANTFNNLTFAARSSTGISTISFGDTQTIVGTLHIQSGYGATFDITDTAGAITAATVNAGGTGYNVGDVLNVTGGNGDAQLTVATLSGTAIATVTISTPGTGYTTATGVATTLATSALNPNRRMLVNSGNVGTARTITAAAVNITNADFRDITGAGAATWNDSGRTRYWGNCLGNSGITFSAGVSKYRIGTGNWSATQWAASSGGSPAVADFPLAQDTCVFDANTTTGTHVVDNSYQLGSLDMSALTVAVTLAIGSSAPFFYGNVTLDADVTPTGTGTITFAGQGTTQTITSAGRTFPQPLTVNSPSGTVTLADALTTSSSLTLTAGALDLGNQVLTSLTFVSGNANTRSIAFGTGKIQVTGNNANVVNMGDMTNFTYTGSGLFECTYSGSSGVRGLALQHSGTISESNAINVSVIAGSDRIDTNAGFADSHINNLDFTGFSGDWNVGGTSTRTNIYGNLVVPSSTTVNSANGELRFASASKTQTVTTSGKTLDFAVAKLAAGSLQLADNFTVGSTRTFVLSQGTLDLNDKTLSTGTFSSNNANVRDINFGSSGELRILEGGTSFNAGTGTNLTTSGTGTINMLNAAGKTFAGGGRTYPTLNQGGTSALAITGANTFADISNVADGYADTGRYNLLTYTEDLSNSAWAFTAVTKTVSGFTAQNLNNAHTIAQSISFATGVTYIFTIRLTYINNRYVSLRIFDSSQFPHAVFDLVSGAFIEYYGTGTLTGATIVQVSPGVFDLSVAKTSVAAGTGNISVFLVSPTWTSGTNPGNAWLALGTESVGATRAQVVPGPYPGVYQKVEDASTFTPQPNAFSEVAITFPSGVTTSVQDFSVGGTLGNLVTLNASTPGSRAILNRV